MDTRGFNFLSWSCFIFHFSSMYYCIQSFSHIINLERSCYFSTMTAQDSVPKRCDVGSFGGGGESRTFLGRDAPVRNDVPDGWRKQILKGSMEKQGLWLGSNKMWTAMNTQQTIQIFFYNREGTIRKPLVIFQIEGEGGGRDDVWEGVRTTYSTPQDPTLLSFIWILGVSLPSFTEWPGMVDHLLILKLEQHWTFALEFVVRGLA